jgi:hypothetical protein
MVSSVRSMVVRQLSCSACIVAVGRQSLDNGALFFDPAFRFRDVPIRLGQVIQWGSHVHGTPGL